MHQEGKISVIVPVYKVEKYIGACVKSICDQTFENIKIIVVDDETPDNSIEVAENILKESGRGYKIVHRKNGGLSAARNTGLEHADGEWISFIDSDDILHPKFLEYLYNAAIENASEISIVDKVEIIDSEPIDFISDIKKGQVYPKEEFLWKVLERKVVPFFCCFLIKRELIDKHYIKFNETVRYSVDQPIMWQLMIYSNKIVYNNSALYIYNLRPGSIMTGSGIDKITTGYSFISSVIKSLPDNQFPYPKSLILHRWRLGILHSSSKLIPYDQFVTVAEKIEFDADGCMTFPNKKVAMLARIYKISRRLMYNVLKRI